MQASTAHTSKRVNTTMPVNMRLVTKATKTNTTMTSITTRVLHLHTASSNMPASLLTVRARPKVKANARVAVVATPRKIPRPSVISQ